MYSLKADKTECNDYIAAINFIQKFFEYPFLKVKPIHRNNYWRSSVWVST
jgi:hypothetical protein